MATFNAGNLSVGNHTVQVCDTNALTCTGRAGLAVLLVPLYTPKIIAQAPSLGPVVVLILFFIFCIITLIVTLMADYDPAMLVGRGKQRRMNEYL